MKISGTQSLPFPPEEAYRIMQDPEVLAKAIPGCEGLEKTGEDEYKMKMKMAMASVSGNFEGKVKITGQNPAAPGKNGSFRLMVEGSGKIGFVKGDGLLTLTAKDNGTEVSYDGDAQVGGTIAAVGQRLIDMTSKMMIKKFFEKLAAG